jgi:hypothetical protein
MPTHNCCCISGVNSGTSGLSARLVRTKPIQQRHTRSFANEVDVPVHARPCALEIVGCHAPRKQESCGRSECLPPHFGLQVGPGWYRSWSKDKPERWETAQLTAGFRSPVSQ